MSIKKEVIRGEETVFHSMPDLLLLAIREEAS